MRWIAFCGHTIRYRPSQAFHRSKPEMAFVFSRFVEAKGLAAVPLVVLLAFAWSAPAWSQVPGETALQRVERAIAAGDERGVVHQASDRIEIALLGAGMVYSESQAEFVLRSFFRDHPPARFAFTEVTRTPERIFAVGHYRSTQDERPMRVYVRLQRRAERWVVQGVRIDQRSQP